VFAGDKFSCPDVVVLSSLTLDFLFPTLTEVREKSKRKSFVS
jgi:hypothetical protein